MFFPEKIKNIGPNDRVLEIGPGGNPHPRSDVFLELKYSNEKDFLEQTGGVPRLKTNKPVIFYNGKKFPFKDKEFDYIICSHVIEHVPNLDYFISELLRVGKKGYIEFPTIFYEYLYNFKSHCNVCKFNGNILYFMPKSNLGLDKFSLITSFFYTSLNEGYDDIVLSLKTNFVEGFEWDGKIILKKTADLSILTSFESIPPNRKTKRFIFEKMRFLI